MGDYNDLEFLHNCVQNCISKLEKDARYRCELCRFKLHHAAIRSHITDDRKHRGRYTAFKDDLITFCLPEPGEAQISAINDMVEGYATRLLTKSQTELRMAAIAEIESTVNEWFPRTRIHLRPYGSIVSGFALDSSDVNVELILDNEHDCNSAQVLQNVAMQMELHPDTYYDVHKEFDISSPRFSFRYNSPLLGSHSSIVVHFGVYSSSSLEVAEILAKYVSLDTRVAKLAACLKIWAQLCGFDRADHGFWPSHSFHIMAIHFLQQTSPPVLPSLFPLDGTTPSEKDIEAAYHELKFKWVSKNNKNLGQLWIQLLAYYAKDFCGKNVVNVRGLPNLTLKSKEWSTCILAVEDPIHHNHNLSRSIGRKELYYNFHYNLVRTYSYFMTPRTRAESLLNNLTDFIHQINSPSLRSLVNDEDSDEDDQRDRESEDEVDSEEPRGSSKMGKKQLNFTYHVRLAKKFGISFQLRTDSSDRWASLPPDSFFYTLEINRYPFFKSPPKYCIKCKKIDHYKTECPAEKLPELLIVPFILNPQQSSRLDDVCLSLYYTNRLDPFYEVVHRTVLETLTGLVREIYPNANLQLFGSSKNGFGAKKCDLDLCMTFADNETGVNIDQTEVIQKLARDLKRNQRDISNLQPIPQAKVPVLKLRFRLDQPVQETFDCDISLYNLLASYNTRLLRTYCEIDERVAMLGFTVKQFFKTCGICDASKGSLSSYAYTLMTLYYLQRCSPPVIPVLQELYDGDSPPEHIVDGYNTWFFSDLDRLSEKWPYQRANTLSVGNLFYGFLKFYAEIFPFDTLVVCIRRSRDLTKMEKKWTGRRISIEDPFLLSHNLGQGIESEMARYIKASIILGRNRIGRQPDALDSYSDWADYFFDARYLHDGPFPKGRGCHYCNRIGHQRSNCPERINNKGNIKRLFDSPRGGLRFPSKRENRNRKGGEFGEFMDNEFQNPNPSPLGRLYRQLNRLEITPVQSHRENRSHYQESSSPSISGNISNNSFERNRSDRTLYNPNPKQHPPQFYRHQTPKYPPSQSRGPGNSNSHFNNNNHHNHPNHLQKRNGPPNNHPHQYQQFESQPFTGNGNRPGNLRFSRPQNNFHPDGYIFKSPEFPELANSSKRDSGRRR